MVRYNSFSREYLGVIEWNISGLSKRSLVKLATVTSRRVRINFKRNTWLQRLSMCRGNSVY